MRQVIGGKLYDTKTAELIADNEFTDGSNRRNHGRNVYLYKTKKGNFFVVDETQWQGEHDNIEPISIDEAKNLFERLDGGDSYETTFGEALEEA